MLAGSTSTCVNNASQCRILVIHEASISDVLERLGVQVETLPNKVLVTCCSPELSMEVLLYRIRSEIFITILRHSGPKDLPLR